MVFKEFPINETFATEKEVLVQMHQNFIRTRIRGEAKLEFFLIFEKLNLVQN